jgi:hypothetical protein
MLYILITHCTKITLNAKTKIYQLKLYIYTYVFIAINDFFKFFFYQYIIIICLYANLSGINVLHNLITCQHLRPLSLNLCHFFPGMYLSLQRFKSLRTFRAELNVFVLNWYFPLQSHNNNAYQIALQCFKFLQPYTLGGGPKIQPNVHREKEYKISTTSVIKHFLKYVNNHPICENSPNLVTLFVTAHAHRSVTTFQLNSERTKETGNRNE